MAHEDETFYEASDGIYKFILSFTRNHWMTIMTDMEAEHGDAFREVKAFFAEPDNISADHMNNEALGDIVSKVMFGFLVEKTEYQCHYVDDGSAYGITFPIAYFGSDAVERDGGVANVILDLLERSSIRDARLVRHYIFNSCNTLINFVITKLMEHVTNMPPILCKNDRLVQIDNIVYV